MKRIVFIFCLIFIVAGLVSAQARAGGTLYVAVKTLTLKAGKDFFAGNKGTLSYGDKVTVLKVDGKFVEVQNPDKPTVTGWTSTSNFSTKQIVAGTASTTSAREVALAGKGFSQQAENSLKAQKTNLNYSDVDKIEAIKVSDKNVKKFLEEGKLKLGEK